MLQSILSSEKYCLEIKATTFISHIILQRQNQSQHEKEKKSLSASNEILFLTEIH